MDAKAQRMMVAVDDKLTEEQVSEQLLTQVSGAKKEYGYICVSLYLTILWLNLVGFS